MADTAIKDLTAGTAPDAKTYVMAGQSGSNDRKFTGDQIMAGWQTVSIGAPSLTPRSADGCAALATSNGASGQPDVPYLAFDGAAKEYASICFVLPNSYKTSSVLRARFKWRRASGTGAANVVWGVRGIAIADSESPAQNFGADATVTDAADTTTADFAFSDWTGNITLAGTPAGGQLAFIEVFRDGAAGGDTLDAVDAWLTAVELQFETERADDRVPS